ncbi:MAG: DUF4870 domain-containing protein [Oscillospiraceae bacterium]|nr:DUF4870 domain-containing protein [Oscillospiraceae bacterium]
MENNKLMGILSYIGILVLIPIFAAKDDPFVRYHANQGLVNFIVALVAGVLTAIPIVGIVAGLVGIVCFVFSILGIINAVKGEMKPLPFIGGIQIIK